MLSSLCVFIAECIQVKLNLRGPTLCPFKILVIIEDCQACIVSLRLLIVLVVAKSTTRLRTLLSSTSIFKHGGPKTLDLKLNNDISPILDLSIEAFDVSILNDSHVDSRLCTIPRDSSRHTGSFAS